MLDALVAITAVIIVGLSSVSMVPASRAGQVRAEQIASKLEKPEVSTASELGTASSEQPSKVKLSVITSGKSVIETAESVTKTRENVTEPAETVSEYIFTQEDIKAVAKTVYGEARGCDLLQQAGVVWCILNRVDADGYPDTIIGVITQRNQFAGYSASHPVTQEIQDLVTDVLNRWMAEKDGAESCGRVLPKEYLFFTGDGSINRYRTEYCGGTVWDWSLPNPYEWS